MFLYKNYEENYSKRWLNDLLLRTSLPQKIRIQMYIYNQKAWKGKNPKYMWVYV